MLVQLGHGRTAPYVGERTVSRHQNGSERDVAPSGTSHDLPARKPLGRRQNARRLEPQPVRSAVPSLSLIMIVCSTCNWAIPVQHAPIASTMEGHILRAHTRAHTLSTRQPKRISRWKHQSSRFPTS